MRLLIDTNVWMYLAESVRPSALRDEARRHKVTIVAAPAVLYEVLRMPETQRVVRDQALAMIAADWWSRPMPEAYDESMELLGEVRRLRPMWLSQNPVLEQFNQLRADWSTSSRGTWWRARYQADKMAVWIGGVDDPLLKRGEQDYKIARSLFREQKVQQLPPDAGSMTNLAPGTPRHGIETWRTHSEFVARGAFARRSTYLDWLSPWLDVSAVGSSLHSWERFWYHDVQAANMPRWWLRETMRLHQSTRKVNAGSPVDNQIASYVFGSDGLLTADKTFAQLVNVVGQVAPRPAARAYVVPAGPSCFPAVVELLEGLRRGKATNT